ncbi:MAG: hypothetical protein V2I53_02455 [Paracoccaceae bacterium]|jgi:hypothetical protein|nr:hypothetical protein [Paracoccaceae bacterium]
MDNVTNASALGSSAFWLEATVFAAVFSFMAPIVWKAMGHITDRIIFSLSLRTRKDTFSLRAVDNVPEEITSLKYILVRYGNDKYLSSLASDSEKFQGRLRNKIHDVTTNLHGSSVSIRFQIKVHQRLGTQFKLFVECQGDPKPVVDFLSGEDGVIEPEAVSHPKGARVYFLLKRFSIVETVDGIRNNMIYPE